MEEINKMRTEEEEAAILARHKAEAAIKKSRMQQEPQEKIIKTSGFRPIVEDE
jgi:hypothetical protein